MALLTEEKRTARRSMKSDKGCVDYKVVIINGIIILILKANLKINLRAIF